MSTRRELRPNPNPTLVGAALAIAPVAVGCAAGLLLATRVKGSARESTAALLFTVGAVATLPLVIDTIARSVNRSTSRRAADRRLEGIRGADEFFADDLV